MTDTPSDIPAPPEQVVAETPIPEFTSTDEPWYFEERNVDIYAIGKDALPEGIWDPDLLKGMIVKLNGNEVLVWGIESHPIIRSEQHPYRLKFGIVVKRD